MKPSSKRRGGNPNRRQQPCDPGNRVHESASAKGKIRGTARQLAERYLQFAEEARLANDRVASEAFLQSAEHYVRIGKPAPAIENEPAPATHPGWAPAATVKRFSAEGMPKEGLVPKPTVPSPEPDPVIVSDEAKHQEDEALRQASIAAKRAVAAAKVEQVALQHGYTLAQLGLALRSE